MKRVLERFSLPLLTKDLIEQSARPQLFVIRFVYFCLLTTLAAVYIVPQVQGQQYTPVALLGVGKSIFVTLITLQFCGIYLFLPSLCCGAITVEKERNTIGLLFLTRLEPWTIIIEKLGSRFTLMATLLLTSLPPLAFTYSLGGIDTFDLFYGVWFLAVSAILVSSLAIFASAFFRTTVIAFEATYLMLIALSVGPFFIDGILLNGLINKTYAHIAENSLEWVFGSETKRLGEFVDVIWFPPALFKMFGESEISNFYIATALVVLSSLPSLLIAGLAIWIARMCLVPRAFIPETKPLLNLFKMVDSAFQMLNQRFARGVVIVKESQSLPDGAPIAWRETAKRSLGQFRYLVRILLVLELPTLCLLIDMVNSGFEGEFTGMRVGVFWLLLWIFTAVLIVTQASTLITAERARQTLDVLLTTPLSGRQIILDKLAGVRRLMMVCAIPMLTCVIFQTGWSYDLQGFGYGGSSPEEVWRNSLGSRTQPFLWHEYLITSLIVVVVNLNFVAWLALWLGIRSKSPARAILRSMAVLVGWSVLPLLPFNSLKDLIWLLANGFEVEERYLSFLKLIPVSSPATLVIFLMNPMGLYTLCPIAYLPVIVHVLIFGSCWYWCRRRVLRFANPYLGRGRLHSPPAIVSAQTLPQPSAATA